MPRRLPVHATRREYPVTGCQAIHRAQQAVSSRYRVDTGETTVDREPTPAELLAQAIDGLAPAERTRVFAWLLNQTFVRDPASGLRQAVVASMPITASHETSTLLSRTLVRRGEHQVVPIRLPSEQHTALRDWCQEHGFAMATVVRGLVERFLEERGLLQRGPEPAKPE
jgi:hypothetical protein